MIVNTVFECDTNPSGGVNEGAIFHHKVTVNGTDQNYTFHRRVAHAKVDPGNKCNPATFLYLDLSTDDIVRVRRRFLNTGRGTNDKLFFGGTGNVFAMIRIDEGTPANNYFSIRRSSTTTGFDGGKSPVDWGANIEVDSDFSHSATVNNSRVTLPTAKVLLVNKLGVWHPSPPVDKECGWNSKFQLDGTTTLDYGHGHSTTNWCDPTYAPLQHQSDIIHGVLFDADGEYVEVNAVEGIGSLCHCGLPQISCSISFPASAVLPVSFSLF